LLQGVSLSLSIYLSLSFSLFFSVSFSLCAPCLESAKLFLLRGQLMRQRSLQVSLHALHSPQHLFFKKLKN
jgi:hypothetical protein